MKKTIKKWLASWITHFHLTRSIASMSRARRFPILFWKRLAGLANASYAPKGSIDTGIPLGNNDEMLLRLDLAEDFDRSIYFFGAHEKETADFMSQRFQSPEIRVFYDIGANIGFYTIMAGKLMRSKQGCVEAFEPIPWIYKRLMQNVEINFLKNVRAHPFAVSELSGAATIYLPHGNSAFSTNATLNSGLAQEFNHLFASQGTHVDELQIQTESIDALVEKGKILPPQLIHMDIEGEEFKALVGMKNILRTYMPEIILEILPGRHADIRSFLGDLNYQLYHMSSGKLYACTDSCIRHSGRDWYAKVGVQAA